MKRQIFPFAQKARMIKCIGHNVELRMAILFYQMRKLKCMEFYSNKIFR